MTLQSLYNKKWICYLYSGTTYMRSADGIKTHWTEHEILKKSPLERWILHECGFIWHFSTSESGAVPNCFWIFFQNATVVLYWGWKHGGCHVNFSWKDERTELDGWKERWGNTLLRTLNCTKKTCEALVIHETCWMASETVFDLVFFN